MPKELNLDQNIEVLVVTIKDKKYKVPLATSLPYKKAKALMKLANANEEEAIDTFMEFFAQYIPQDVLDELPMTALTQLAKRVESAWGNRKHRFVRIGALRCDNVRPSDKD